MGGKGMGKEMSVSIYSTGWNREGVRIGKGMEMGGGRW